jgi:hypothetical protein
MLVKHPAIVQASWPAHYVLGMSRKRHQQSGKCDSGDDKAREHGGSFRIHQLLSTGLSHPTQCAGFQSDWSV